MSCTVTCHMYSGRPDPEWIISEKQLMKLKSIWKELEEIYSQQDFPSFLGYRGVSLNCNEVEYYAFNGRVKCQSKNKITWKLDKAGSIEKFLLSTAPIGTLPADLTNGIT